MTRETEYVNVILKETFGENAAEQQGLVRDSDFLNMLTTLVREQDPEALNPQRWFIQVDDRSSTYIRFEGDAQKIVNALGNALAGPQRNGSLLLSEVFPTASGKTQEEPRRVVLTVNGTLYDLVKKEKLPVGGLERVNGKVVDFAPGK